MIKSMTGYGRATGSFDGMDITLELKSVNHRYFEFSSRVPRNFGFLDEKLKSFFQGKISRGKVECYVQIDTAGEESAVVKLNSALAKGYLAACKELSETCGIENDIKVSDLARVNDIFTVSNRILPISKHIWVCGRICWRIGSTWHVNRLLVVWEPIHVGIVYSPPLRRPEICNLPVMLGLVRRCPSITIDTFGCAPY